MRRPAGERERQPLAGQRRVGKQVAIEGMEHHRRVDAFERARLEQPDLAPATLLGGRAEQKHFAAQIIRNRREPEERADGAARDQVVPARVPDFRQRIVLGEDGDARPAGAPYPRAERSRQAAHAAFHRHARLFDGVREPCGRLLLLEPQLGVGVDLPRQLRNRRSSSVDR